MCNSECKKCIHHDMCKYAEVMNKIKEEIDMLLENSSVTGDLPCGTTIEISCPGFMEHWWNKKELEKPNDWKTIGFQKNGRPSPCIDCPNHYNGTGDTCYFCPNNPYKFTCSGDESK